MKVLVLGGDGYLGWPTSMHLAARNYSVCSVDNYLRRTLARQTSSEALFETPNLKKRAELFKERSGYDIETRIGDLRNMQFTEQLFAEFQPDAVIHYAEQPSAPYSLMGYEEAHLTMQNNLEVTHNIIWSIMKHTPDCHLVKIGTMGEYGTPNIDIEEGWIDITHKGRTDKFLFPRAAGSLYHTTKVLDTDLLWFYVRTFGLRATDLMQGPVYGLSTTESDLDAALLPNFHYDDIFGTVVNRFVAQAVAGVPLTVYGKGGQSRGYLNLKDTMQCIELAVKNPANKGELKIYNQLTETFKVTELAEKIQLAGKELSIKVDIQSIENPRKESEDHYYNPTCTGLLNLGLEPHYMTTDALVGIMELVLTYKDRIDIKKIYPRVKWNQ